MNSRRLEENWRSVNRRIAEAEARAGRPAGSARLVAVTKRRPAEWVRALIALGATDIGENYPQELWEKAAAVADTGVRVHLIGRLQRNKAKRTAPLTCRIHGVDSLELLETLDDLSSRMTDPPRICLQLNLSGEESKQGWSEEELAADGEAIAGLKFARVDGLMTMAALGTDSETARPTFAALREARDRLEVRLGRALPELSMGMSGDFEAAVEEGATLVRVGSALFEGVDES
ncbi:MAG: YggS family pyridoxal phosphate-dependent enzyme [Isosphaeraceae bacterium]|nr:YggS family pyridoxal phosphate-dependent enzyme [Isosphaeraceae bacterium]